MQAGGYKVRFLCRAVVSLHIFTCVLGATAQQGPRGLQFGELNREKPEQSVLARQIEETGGNAGGGEGVNWPLPLGVPPTEPLGPGIFISMFIRKLFLGLLKCHLSAL